MNTYISELNIFVFQYMTKTRNYNNIMQNARFTALKYRVCYNTMLRSEHCNTHKISQTNRMLIVF